MSEEAGDTMAEPRSARDELREAMSRKDDMETEISALVAHLDSVGVGLKGPLVDADGYPRGDIDVIDVRKKRHRVAVLQTDHQQEMKRIEELLVAVHAEARAKREVAGAVAAASESKSSLPAGAGGATGGAAAPVGGAGGDDDEFGVAIGDAPVAVVDSVAPDSPAAEAGLQAGDEVMRFGSATATSTGGSLNPIAEIVQRSINRAIEVVVRRGSFRESGSLVKLSLTPHPWDGRGVLGVHLLPVAESAPDVAAVERSEDR